MVLRRLRTASARESLLLLLPLALSAYVYHPITAGYFYADDFLNLYRIVNADLLDYLLRPHGGHLLFARNALFYLFFQAFGMHAGLYLWAVLITHLVNVALLFGVIDRLTDSAPLAAFGAALWGASPLHAEALVWYSVYGQVVVGTILLLILFQAAGVARRSRPLTRVDMVLWPVLLVLGCTCFGIGIGVAIVAPAVLFLLLPRSPRAAWLCVGLAVIALALPVLYRAALALHAVLFGASSEVFMSQMLSAGLRSERVVTMLGLLFSAGVAVLLPGLAALARAHPDLPAYAAVLFGLLVIATLVRSPAETRRAILALLLLSAASYGLIAVGRSGFFEPEKMAAAAAQSRYHYVATAPLVAVLCLMLGRLGEVVRAPDGVKYAALAVFAAVMLVSAAAARPFISLHPTSRAEVERVGSAVTSAVSASAPAAAVYIRNQTFHSVGNLLVLDPASFPGWAAVFTFLFPSNVVDGRRVYFVVDDPAVRAAAGSGKRSAGLLVPPADADGRGGAAEPQSS